MVGVTTTFGTGVYTAGQSHCLTFPKNIGPTSNCRLIYAVHGHGADSQTFNQNAGPGKGIIALVKTGRYVVMSTDNGGPNVWGSGTVVSDKTTALAWARTQFPSGAIYPTKYGVHAWSMGGAGAGNIIKRDAANIPAAWTWSPVVDLDWAYSTVGHSPQANNATWTTEINTEYGSYAATAGYRIWDEAASAFGAIATKWKICRSLDDTVVPPAIQDTFVASANNPNITILSVPTGGHTNTFAYIDDETIVRHYDSGAW